jgi:N-acetylmuramoyl-L-alanine amidase
MSPRAVRHRKLAWFAGLLAAGAFVATGCSSSREAASSRPAVVASVSGLAGGLPHGRDGAAAGMVRAASPGRRPAEVLAGKVVGIDPGHNGRNYADPAFINHLIWNGREEETCDTTGTATDGGYTEARFNWNVATYLSADLRAEGAKVVLTRRSNDGVGPCVTTRSQIINRAHANVAIDIHADGGPPGGRGFAILEPVADGPNDRVIAASKAFGRELRQRYLAVTHMPESTYDGTDGIAYRDDLAGLNLTRVPKVLIECGNMRNATDAALLVRPAFQRLAAKAFADAITRYLVRRR